MPTDSYVCCTTQRVWSYQQQRKLPAGTTSEGTSFLLFLLCISAPLCLYVSFFISFLVFLFILPRFFSDVVADVNKKKHSKIDISDDLPKCKTAYYTLPSARFTLWMCRIPDSITVILYIEYFTNGSVYHMLFDIDAIAKSRGKE